MGYTPKMPCADLIFRRSKNGFRNQAIHISMPVSVVYIHTGISRYDEGASHKNNYCSEMVPIQLTCFR